MRCYRILSVLLALLLPEPREQVTVWVVLLDCNQTHFINTSPIRIFGNEM